VQVDLTCFPQDALRCGVEAAIRGASASSSLSLPSSTRLAQGARATLDGCYEETSAYFQSILELAWLVSSADGFAEEERHALALLLENVTGKVVSHDVLASHFRDLAQGCEMLGRRERLRRAAEDFADRASRSEALGFATLVALADGRLTDPEQEALMDLGGFFGFSRDQVDHVIQDAVDRLRAELQNRYRAEA